MPNPRRRHSILAEAVLACLDERMPRSALHFETALVHSASHWSAAGLVSEALTRRAAIYHTLGADDLAASDLRESRRWILRVTDKSLAERLHAEADATEGEVLVQQQPEQASRSLGQSLAYFQAVIPVRLPVLHLLRARAERARGLDDAAEGELLAGIEALEHERLSLRDAALQVSFFDQALPLFDDMVRLQVENHHDPEQALGFVERGRARQLVDSLIRANVAPFEPDALRRELPAGLALIYYTTLDDRLFAWTLTREGSHFIERSLPAAELSRLVAANRAAIDGGTTPRRARPPPCPFYCLAASARFHP